MEWEQEVISFCLFELGCKNIDEVYELTWKEYQLKRDGYLRETINRQYTTRTIAYYSLVATGAIDTKKMSMEKFMPIQGETKENRISDSQRNALIEAQKLAVEEAMQKKLANG